jgi:hypothetical protein
MSKYGYKIWVLRADNVGHCNACRNSSNNKPIDGSRPKVSIEVIKLLDDYECEFKLY